MYAVLTIIDYLPVKCVVVEKMLILRGGVLRAVGGRDTQYHQDRPTTLESHISLM